MCGRYTANTEDEIVEMREILKILSIRLDTSTLGDFTNFGQDIFPSTNGLIITNKQILSSMKWGFSRYNSNDVVFNARIESIYNSSFYKDSIKSNHCIVPANSYYEWEKNNDNSKTKYRIKKSDEKIQFIAGLVQKNSNDSRYTIITKNANEDIKFIHHRMPVILTMKQIPLWLSGGVNLEQLINENLYIMNFEKVG